MSDSKMLIHGIITFFILAVFVAGVEHVVPETSRQEQPRRLSCLHRPQCSKSRRRLQPIACPAVTATSV